MTLIFWYDRYKPSKLKLEKPELFAFSKSASDSLIYLRLPLIFSTTGAKKILVENCQVNFPDVMTFNPPLAWEAITNRLIPTSHDSRDAPTPFMIQGRQSKQIFAEFQGIGIDILSGNGWYRTQVLIQSNGKKEWKVVCDFDLDLSQVIKPGYFTYRNTTSKPN